MDQCVLGAKARARQDGSAVSKQTHGGAGRGQGRKPLPDDERTVVVTVRLTPARRDKLRRLGAQWLAKAVDRAKEADAT